MSKASGESTIDIDPSIVYFTFSRIRPQFSCGRTIDSTLNEFLAHTLCPTDLPLLSVLTDGTHYYSQNNRRLYMYKKLKEMGELQTVPVRLRPLPSTKRMKEKYTPEKCAMTATLMRVGQQQNNSGGGNNAVSGASGIASDGEDEDSCEERENPSPTTGGGEQSAQTRDEEQGKKEAKVALKQQQPSPAATASGKGGKKNKKKAQQRRCASSSSSEGGRGKGSLEDELRKLGLQ